MKKMLLALIVVIIIFGLGRANAAPTRDWGDSGITIAAAMAFAEQAGQQAVADGAGGAYVAWLDRRIAGTYYGVFAQRINSSGTKLWTTNGVSICATNVMDISMAADASGNLFIAWEDYRSGAGSGDIYVQKLNSSGVPQWTADGVGACADVSIGGQSSPKVLVDGSGGCFVTWADQRSGPQDIRAQRLNSAGSRQWGDSGAAVCTASDSQGAPEIISDSSGGAIVCWTDFRSGIDNDIYAQRVNSSGAPQWTTNGVTVCAAANEQSSQKMISDGAGGAIIAWNDARDGGYDIYAQKLKSNGSLSWVTDGVTLCAEANYQMYPEIVTDGAGGAIVAWTDSRPLDKTPDIYAQKVDSGGTVGGGSWPVNGRAICSAAKAQQAQKIIPDGAGGAIIAWNDNRVGSDMKTFPGMEQYDIYAQRVSNAGAVAWAADGVAVYTGLKGTGPNPVSDGSSGAIIVFGDNRSGDMYLDIYGQRINSSGSNQWGTGMEICAAKAGAAQSQPVLYAGSSGVVAWVDAREGAQDVYALKFTSSGSPDPGWPSEGAAVCTDAQLGLSGGKTVRNVGGICQMTDGNYAVVWEDNRAGNSDIYAQLLDGNTGTRLGPLGGFALVSQTSDQSQPRVVPDGGDGIIVFYVSGESGSASKTYYLKTEKMISPPLNLLANTWVSDAFGLPDIDGMLLAKNGVPLPPAPAAGVICAKRVSQSSGFVWGGEAGSASGAGLLVNTFSDSNMTQRYPSAANIGGGSVVVVWQDDRSDTTNDAFDIYGQKISISDGSRQWADAGVAICTAANNQVTPRVTKAGDGVVAVTWGDNRTGRSYTDPLAATTLFFDVYAQKLNCAGSSPSPQWTADGVAVAVQSGYDSAEQPHVTVDPLGTNVIAYLKQNPSAASYDILIQALNTGGTKLLSSPFAVATYAGYKNYPGVAATGIDGQVYVSWDPVMVVTGPVIDTNIEIQSISWIGVTPPSTTTTTTTTTTTITLTLISNPKIAMPRQVQLLKNEAQIKTLQVLGSDFRSGLKVKLVKVGRPDEIFFGRDVTVSGDGKNLTATFDIPSKMEKYVGAYDIVVSNPDGASTTFGAGFRLEWPEGDVFLYRPPGVKFSALRAAAPAQQARIAYTLSADKSIDILIYDVREMKVVFRRKIAAGQYPGGAFGYNEIAWNGLTDLGNTIPNGTYVLQIVSGGKIVGQTYFVVRD